jgi:hypothetical protein
MKKIVGLLSVCLLAAGSTASAALATWTGSGNGTNWNDASNWSDSAIPSTTAELTIDTASTITKIYRDTGTSTYSAANSFKGIINLNQGTLAFGAIRHDSGSDGVFNIGDGSGTADAIVSFINGGWWVPDRYDGGTYTINIKSDGQLNMTGNAYFASYTEPALDQDYVMNIMGGSLNMVSHFTVSDNQPEYINLSLGGTITCGALTVVDDVFHFADLNAGNSITAAYGRSFVDEAAVAAAFGTTFTSTVGGELQLTDNGTSFTISCLPVGTVIMIK